MSAACELDSELRCNGEPEDLAEMCKRFLQFTMDIAPTARRYPGGSAALLRDRTAAARCFAWFSNEPRGTGAFGSTTAGEVRFSTEGRSAVTTAPRGDHFATKKRRLLTWDRVAAGRAPIDRNPAPAGNG